MSGTGLFPWVLAYFRQIYPHRVEQGSSGTRYVKLSGQPLLVEALHFAYSHDGIRWTPLNDNRPVADVAPQFSGLRDPFLARGADGQFHLVATGGQALTSILYTCSADLITWEPARELPVVAGIPGANNAWAPEFIFDERERNYLLFWSSARGQHGWEDSRIWCARTDDFSHISQPRVLFEPGFTVIDATIVAAPRGYVMVFKDERFGDVLGEHRALRVAVSDHLAGGYSVVTGAVTPVITEGPAVMRLPDRDEWYLCYDYCMDDRYGLSRSTDLIHWEQVKGASFPANARHGSICPVTDQELDRLLAEWSISEDCGQG